MIMKRKCNNCGLEHIADESLLSSKTIECPSCNQNQLIKTDLSDKEYLLSTHNGYSYYIGH